MMRDEQSDNNMSWMQSFLDASYSEECSVHEIARNNKDHFCITCGTSVCQFCVEGGMHLQHKLLKIYKHVYNDVVSLTAMQKHMDCSKIQPYRSNKRMVIALSALPHSGSAARQNAPGCETCQRRIAQPGIFTYCSITCQVAALSRDLNTNAAAVADPPQSPPEEEEAADEEESAEEGSGGWSGSQTPRRKRTRIGKPSKTPPPCFF